MNKCATCQAELSKPKPPLVIRDRAFCADCADEAKRSFRAHLAEESKKILVATTSELDGYRVTAYLGTVYGPAMHVMSGGQDVVADFTDYMGHGGGSYEATIQRLHGAAERKLRLAAAFRQAHAVIGARFDVEFVEVTDDKSLIKSRDRKILVAGVGTAVTVERI